MRNCIRCACEMVEDLHVAASGGGYEIDVREKGFFKGSLGRLRSAVCPACGYAETYLENSEKLKLAMEKRQTED